MINTSFVFGYTIDIYTFHPHMTAGFAILLKLFEKQLCIVIYNIIVVD